MWNVGCCDKQKNKHFCLITMNCFLNYKYAHSCNRKQQLALKTTPVNFWMRRLEKTHINLAEFASHGSMCMIFKSDSLNTFYCISSQKNPRSLAKHGSEESYTELSRAVTMNILVQRRHKDACAYIRGFNEKTHKEVAEKLNSGGITWIKCICIFSPSLSHSPAFLSNAANTGLHPRSPGHLQNKGASH